MAVILALAAIFMTLQAYAFGKIPNITDFRTIAFPTPSEWLADPWISMLINILVVLATGAVMILINRHFNLLRTTSVFSRPTSCSLWPVSLQSWASSRPRLYSDC